jgi:hypothetical protein
MAAECGMTAAFPWSKQCRNALLLLPADTGALRYGDEKVANRDTKVWAGATRKWSLNDSQSTNLPRCDCRSCRYITLCRGVLDLYVIR